MLKEIKDFDSLPPGSDNYSLTYARKDILLGWALDQEVFEFHSTWTEPPQIIHPSDAVSMTMGLAVSKDIGTGHSANASYDVYFDTDSTIEPGFVGGYIAFSDGKGGKGNLAATHTGAPHTALSKSLTLDASLLPTGSAGARIALMATVYNGRSVGTRYTYEWQP